MHKISIFVQGINNISSFKEYLNDKVIPHSLNSTTIYRVQITSFGPSVDPTPKNLSLIQFMFEIYFDSTEDMNKFMVSTHGAELLDLLINNPFGEVGTFVGDEMYLIPEQIHRP
ncbi:hypothetical protein SAMN05444392_103305 [Seinonella peptonophila]|uniref:EthD domain-containing protein n=1 Tax=Seinonella peptonophila TaxID=112248 RepID=A0A1M4WNK6_9BACL|nr:hypothetical protein [Seinonella peptonophila]SHE82829.1 hypothetical protein SAMN05444392_103305 [Seinonella peptonophila]